MSSRGSLPKNLIVAHPVQGSQVDKGSGGTCSPATPCAQRYGTGKTEGCRDVDSLRNCCEDEAELTENYGYMDVTGEGDEGSGESQETGSGMDGN